MLMLLLAAAVAAAPSERSSPTAATASAQATVRIVRGATIRFGESARYDASVPRQTAILESDGTTRAASLIEFY